MYKIVAKIILHCYRIEFLFKNMISSRPHLGSSQKTYFIISCTSNILETRHVCTGIGARMSQWKWRETKQHPSRVRSGHQVSCCLISLHFRCDILAPIPVQYGMIPHRSRGTTTPAASTGRSLILCWESCWTTLASHSVIT